MQPSLQLGSKCAPNTCQQCTSFHDFGTPVGQAAEVNKVLDVGLVSERPLVLEPLRVYKVVQGHIWLHAVPGTAYQTPASESADGSTSNLGVDKVLACQHVP